MQGYAEWRAALVVVHVEDAGEPAAWPHELRELASPCRPERTRQRAQKGALVDEIERRFAELEEVRFPDAARKLAELASRALERGIREGDAQDVGSPLGTGAHLLPPS